MVKYQNVFGDEYSGTVAKTGVFAKWKGRKYRRKWVKPSNPRTPMQQSIRSSFSNAVSKYQDFNQYQKEAYNYLSAGLVMSGYNLFISRWQKMSAADRQAYTSPPTGFKQLGLGNYSAEKTVSTTQNTSTYTVGTNPLVIGKTGFDKGTGDLDPVGVVDLQRGRVDILKDLTGTLKISYQSQGKTIEGEILKENPSSGDVLYTKYFPIREQTSQLTLNTTAQHTMEVDVFKNKVYITYPSTYNSGGSITYRDYTPISDVKAQVVKAGTQFVTYRGYSDSKGFFALALTVEDQPYDFTLEAPGIIKVIRSNQSASALASDEYIPLTSV